MFSYPTFLLYLGVSWLPRRWLTLDNGCASGYDPCAAIFSYVLSRCNHVLLCSYTSTLWSRSVHVLLRFCYVVLRSTTFLPRCCHVAVRCGETWANFEHLPFPVLIRLSRFSHVVPRLLTLSPRSVTIRNVANRGGQDMTLYWATSIWISMDICGVEYRCLVYWQASVVIWASCDV
jgi:hypothetical protein